LQSRSDSTAPNEPAARKKAGAVLAFRTLL
jgi:hypothetical protein